MFIWWFSDGVVERRIARKFRRIHCIATCRKTSKDTAAQINLTKPFLGDFGSFTILTWIKMSKPGHGQFSLIIFASKYKFCLPLWATPWKFWNAWKLTFELTSLIRSKTGFAVWPENGEPSQALIVQKTSLRFSYRSCSVKSLVNETLFSFL